LEEIMSHMAEALDTIILDGKAYVLYERPIEYYFRRIDWRPTFIRRGPGPLRGYMARWEIFGERLFLTGLFGMSWIVPAHLHGKLTADPDPFEPAQDGVKSLRLPDLFSDQAPLVFAEWVTERLGVPVGPRLFFGNPFGSFHATHRTFDVVEGRVRSVRNWNALEWARETNDDWLIDEFSKNEPQLLVPTEQNSDADEVDAEDDLPDWRKENDPVRRWLEYRVAQEEALRKPCGQIPSD
jgi:hypothetical protein